MGRRIRWLGIIMLICFALVLVQLMNIQFRKASALANSPNNPQIAAKKFDNLRGTISLADGTVLAHSVRISTSSSEYNYKRVYPQQTASLYAPVTGYDSIFYGTSGIEFWYNQYLQAHPQPPRTLSQLLFNKPPSEPDNVTLTLDPVVQAAAMAGLQSVSGPNKDGAVVVLNPTTGAILAMVSSPTFDPNGLSNPDVAKEEAYNFVASVKDGEGFDGLTPLTTQERFPPGSTFKVVTTAAVYHLKPSLINYSFPPAVSIKFSDSPLTLSNDGFTACGGTMTVMLPQSCDPGYGELGIQLGSAALTQQAEEFGYSIFPGNPSDVPKIDLPHVIPSSITALSPNAQAYLAYSAIGQKDDAATPLQNALVAAGIGNSGVIMTPHVMSRITDSQGNVIQSYNPTVMSTVATATQTATITRLMQQVAIDGTAGGVGFPASWHIAVKTGTAQQPTPAGVEETDDWMIGFLPGPSGASPLAIAVVVPYQSFSVTGAEIAGPIVKRVVGAWLAESGSQ
jgi:peptidoglycan glycosyltransferase